MGENEDSIVIKVNDIEFRKKDIEELISYLKTVQNAYAQAELECQQWKKMYLDKLEENKKE